MLPKDFFWVRERIEKAIKELPLDQAHRSALGLVDGWAAEIIRGNLSRADFGLRIQAEFTVAHTTSHFGILGAARQGAPEVNHAMRDRLRFWFERSSRFHPGRAVRRPVDQNS